MAKPKLQREKLRAGLAEDSARRLLVKYVDYGQGSRYEELNNREAYYRGTQYRNRPYDWNGALAKDSGGTLNITGTNAMLSDRPPASSRQPRAQYDLGRIIVNRFAALLCGADRFATFRVPKSAQTEAFLNAIGEQLQLRPIFSEASTLGGAVGSVVVMFKVVDGEFRLECFNSKYVLVEEWEDFHAGEMSAFAVTYPYRKSEWDEDKRMYMDKWYIYKRVVTATVDVTCKPIPSVFNASDNSIKPEKDNYIPQIDYEESFVHDLGFVPAQFIQNLPAYDQVDGDSTIQCGYGLIDMINEQLSAIHEGLLANLDPTLLLSMSPEDYKKLQSKGGVVQTGSSSGIAIVVGEKGDGKYLEISGEGIKLAMELIEKLRQFLLEVADCVIADPHRITGAAQSAAAIAKLYAAMLAKCDMLRNQYGDALKRLMAKIMRAYMEKKNTTVLDDSDGTAKRKQLFIKQIEGYDPETEKVIKLEPEAHISYKDIALNWGDYFEATAADAFAAVEAAVMAVGGKPVTSQEAAVKYVASFLGDPDPAHTMSDIQKTMKEDEAHELAVAKVGAVAKKTATMKPKSGAGRQRQQEANPET